jgi:hypothetical protein
MLDRHITIFLFKTACIETSEPTLAGVYEIYLQCSRVYHLLFQMHRSKWYRLTETHVPVTQKTTASDVMKETFISDPNICALKPSFVVFCSVKCGRSLHNILFRFCNSVHHRTIQINHQPDATIFQFIILTFIYSSTCFGRSPAHYQELITAVAASGIAFVSW